MNLEFESQWILDYTMDASFDGAFAVVWKSFSWDKNWNVAITITDLESEMHSFEYIRSQCNADVCAPKCDMTFRDRFFISWAKKILEQNLMSWIVDRQKLFD